MAAKAANCDDSTAVIAMPDGAPRAKLIDPRTSPSPATTSRGAVPRVRRNRPVRTSGRASAIAPTIRGGSTTQIGGR